MHVFCNRWHVGLLRADFFSRCTQKGIAEKQRVKLSVKSYVSFLPKTEAKCAHNFCTFVTTVNGAWPRGYFLRSNHLSEKCVCLRLLRKVQERKRQPFCIFGPRISRNTTHAKKKIFFIWRTIVKNLNLHCELILVT
jgi:hypothetical protein